MQSFTFQSPTRITFGQDSALGAAEILRELGCKKTLVITDANLIKAGALQPILAAFDLAKLAEPVVFSQVPPDSDVTCVNAAANLGRQFGCDSVLALGGGSVMDTAKVANICLTFGGDMIEYQGLNNLPSPLLPLIAIPTTAGTGSEVSLVAMIKDGAEKKKLLFGSTFLAPNTAVLDPKLLVGLPAKLTAATGLDALTHDLESYVALASASVVTDALCIESMRLIFKYLEKATKCGDDLEARSATLVASTMAGMAFTNTGVGIVHALAHATGAWFGTHHGTTNGVFLPHGMEFNLKAAGERYASAGRLLGITEAADDAQAARDLIKAVCGLISRCGLPDKLRDLGVPEISKEELVELAEAASTDPAIMFNPREATVKDIISIYKRAY